MSLRIDLLLETERRYQGPVSRKFLLKAVVISVGAVILLWGGLSLQNKMRLNQELRQLEADWSRLETRSKVVEGKRAALSHCEALQKELDGWTKARVAWHERFSELQPLVPASSQLTRLMVKSDWRFIPQPQPPAPPHKEGDTAKPRVVKPLPPIPSRSYLLGISGKAVGDAGADAVRDLPNLLRGVPAYRDLFESIKLQRMVRSVGVGGTSGEAAERIFDIDCQSFNRNLE